MKNKSHSTDVLVGVIDQSTSATKFIIFNSKGKIIE